MKFSMKDGRKFSWLGIDGVAITNGKTESASVAFVKVGSIDAKGVVHPGRHGKIKTTTEDRYYFVISGKGKFIIGNESEDVEKNDLIFVPKNTPYDFEGTMKMVMFFTPAYNPKNEVKLE